MTRHAVLRGRVLAIAVVLGMTAGCSGVPGHSSPQVISTLQVSSPAPQPSVAPPPVGAGPAAIVRGFLNASAATDPRHSSARAYLTTPAQTRWSDDTATVIASEDLPLTQTAGGPGSDTTITVSLHKLGQLLSDGTYKPDLSGNGTRGDAQSATFTLTRKNDQWRIDTLPQGLIITLGTFQFAYNEYSLYYLDESKSRVVPNLRYFAGTNVSEAVELLGELAKPAPPDLSPAVNNDVPGQRDPTRLAVSVDGGIARVELPGTSQLDADTKTLVAGQIALTLDQVLPRATFTITDGGTPVTIPSHPDGFSADDFSALLPRPPIQQLFFVRDGIRVERGQPAPGVLAKVKGTPDAVAVYDAGSRNYVVAVTSGPSGRERLSVGNLQDEQLLDTTVPYGVLSRPAWAPGQDERPEVWVGTSAGIARAVMSAQSADVHPVKLTSAGGPFSGAVVAIAFSVDGARVALVINSGGRQAVWIGSVVRTSQEVRVDGLEQITPAAVHFADVAWNNATRLYAVGYDATNGVFGVWEVKSDGSGFDRRSSTGLPAQPTAITTTIDAFPVVSAAGRLYRQNGNWEPLIAAPDNSLGTNPTYLQ